MQKKMLTFKVSFFHTKQCSNKNNYRVKCEKMLIFALQIEDEDDNKINNYFFMQHFAETR